MKVISGRNVNTIWPLAVEYMREEGVLRTSRVGEVLVAPVPVVTVTEAPMERVLFDSQRDANPFFHLFECLWMLHGGQTTEFLDRFIPDFGQRYAEEGTKTLWGPYGHRWRTAWEFDQLDAVVERLTKYPDDRRSVIAMWDPNLDLWFHLEEGGQEPKDLPCNTHIYLGIYDNHLNMTVCCRSNDIVWGAYGANIVHFSFLQEYLAMRIGVSVGTMYQVSNNWHAYVNVFYKKTLDLKRSPEVDYGQHPYLISPMSICLGKRSFSRTWDNDLSQFMDNRDNLMKVPTNNWFGMVAVPMLAAHNAYKEGNMTRAIDMTFRVRAQDWAYAARNWLRRRAYKAYESKGSE